MDVGVDARRVGEIEYRVTTAAELDTLIDSWEEAATPTGVTAAGAFFAGTENNEGWEVFRLIA